eukprot:COSAG02_NODE_3233_length_7129_cov_27.245946_5_plen_207_part_00
MFKTPVHPSNFVSRVVGRYPNMSISPGCPSSPPTVTSSACLSSSERAPSRTEGEEVAQEKRCQATPGVRRPKPALLRPTPGNLGVPDTMRASPIRGDHGKPASRLRSGAPGVGSWLLAGGVAPRSLRWWIEPPVSPCTRLCTTSWLSLDPIRRERRSWDEAGWWQEPPVLRRERVHVGVVAILLALCVSALPPTDSHNQTATHASR